MRFSIPIAASLLAATTAAGQDAPCPHGRADDRAAVADLTTAVHWARIHLALDSLLFWQGFDVRRPAIQGPWRIAPRHDWPETGGGEAGGKPGLQLDVLTEERGDSTYVRIGARALCVTAAQTTGAEAEDAFEERTAGELAATLSRTLEEARAGSARARELAGRHAAFPEAVGPFRFLGRLEYRDPAQGTRFEYSMEPFPYVDVHVFRGPPAPAACRTDCAAERVAAEARAHTDSLRALVRRGRFGRARVRADEVLAPGAGDAWLAGRHLTLDLVMDGHPMESHVYVYALPGYLLKFRSHFPASPVSREQVITFVRDFVARFAAPD